MGVSIGVLAMIVALVSLIYVVEIFFEPSPGLQPHILETPTLSQIGICDSEGNCYVAQAPSADKFTPYEAKFWDDWFFQENVLFFLYQLYILPVSICVGFGGEAFS